VICQGRPFSVLLDDIGAFGYDYVVFAHGPDDETSCFVGHRLNVLAELDAAA
jgi:hypothetical protein